MAARTLSVRSIAPLLAWRCLCPGKCCLLAWARSCDPRPRGAPVPDSAAATRFTPTSLHSIAPSTAASNRRNQPPQLIAATNRRVHAVISRARGGKTKADSEVVEGAGARPCRNRAKRSLSRQLVDAGPPLTKERCGASPQNLLPPSCQFQPTPGYSSSEPASTDNHETVYF